jgi:hypothetical protein
LRRSHAAGDTPILAVLGALVLLICVGLALTAPAMLVTLLILATPALIRAGVASPGPEGPNKLVVFLSSVGVLTAVGVAAGAAFFAACFAVCAIGSSAGDWRTAEKLAPVAYTAGGIAGLSVAGLLFWKLWRRRS